MTELSRLSLPVPADGQSGPPTFREAEAILRRDPALTETQRRDLSSALHRVAEWLGQPPENLRCSVPFLNDRLFGRHPAVFGVRVSTFRAVCSRLRAVLRLLGEHVPLERGEAMLGPDWRDFLSHVPVERVRQGLRGFARWGDAEGVGPADVSEAHLGAFLRADTDTRLSAASSSLHRTVPRGWNQARAFQPDPAAYAPLTAPRKRERYTKPFDWYEPSFAEDVERFRRLIARPSGRTAAAENGTLSPKGRVPLRLRLYATPTSGPRPLRKRLKPRSVASRLFSLQQGTTALVEMGVPREELRTLRDLVEPIERVADILDHHQARGLGHSSLKTMGGALRLVACHHVGVPEAELALLDSWVKEAAGPRPQGMTLRNRQRLAQLLVPKTLARFLRLPERLLAEAAALPAEGSEALRLGRNALIVDVLISCPLRLDNLRMLHLDEHLQRSGKAGRVTHLVIPGNQTKTGADIFWPLRKETSRRLGLYLREVRPRLAAAGNPYLFPGAGQEPMSTNGLRSAFSLAAERFAGAVVNPHLVRHLAVHLLLTARPGQYETASRLLGHRSTATTRDAYLGLETDASVKLYEEAVLLARKWSTDTKSPGKGRRR